MTAHDNVNGACSDCNHVGGHGEGCARVARQEQRAAQAKALEAYRALARYAAGRYQDPIELRRLANTALRLDGGA